MNPPVLLASASPRRRALFGLLGLAFECCAPDVCEMIPADTPPRRAVALLAERKARAVWRAGRVCVGADTLVALDGHLLGKPENAQMACAMLERLSGRVHMVYTGVCVIGARGARYAAVEQTKVFFAVLDAQTIARYVQTGEPLDKAGAYALQGMAGAFVRRIEGSYDSAVGLPLYRTRLLLARAGVAYTASEEDKLVK